MLISQKIAKDQKFIKSIVGASRKACEEFRVGVMRATKIIVGSDMIEFKSVDKMTPEHFLGKSLSEAKQFERRNLYKEFGRLPFKSIFIENETGGVLVEELFGAEGGRPFHRFILTTVYPFGHLNSYKIVLQMRDDGPGVTLEMLKDEGVYILMPFNWDVISLTSGKQGRDNLADEFQAVLDGASLAIKGIDTKRLYDWHKAYWERDAMLMGIFLLEALLFMNVSNATLVKYMPSQKEITFVPPQHRDKYIYRILDITRSRKQYESIAQIEEDLKSATLDKGMKRAHLVRGHFKRKNGKLFWWNPFMRNRNNAESVGKIDKDYRLVNE